MHGWGRPHPFRDSVVTMTDAPAERGGLQRQAMFPLSAVLYPHAEIPLHVFEPRYRALTRDCLAGDSCFGVVLIERGAEVGGGDQRMAVGTRAVITKAAAFPDGRWLLMARGDGRIRVGEWLADDPYPLAMVEDWAPRVEEVPASLLQRAEQSVRRTRGLLSESGATSALPAETQFDDDPDVASWQICNEAPLNMMDAQHLLSAGGTVERLELLIALTEAMEHDLHRMLASG
jgi:Lon protease-like protein